MLIHLSDVLTVEGKRMEYVVPLECTGIDYHGQTCPVKGNPELKLVLVNQGDYKVEVSLTGTLEAMIPCDRCMEDTAVTVELEDGMELDLSNRFVPGSQEAETEEEMPEECAYLTDMNLDTEELFREALSICLPDKVLCTEECKGICSQCGQNLNHGSCDCDDQPKDPRMAAILDLFNAEFK